MEADATIQPWRFELKGKPFQPQESEGEHGEERVDCDEPRRRRDLVSEDW